jgi:hypothetical protein
MFRPDVRCARSALIGCCGIVSGALRQYLAWATYLSWYVHASKGGRSCDVSDQSPKSDIEIRHTGSRAKNCGIRALIEALKNAGTDANIPGPVPSG